jgi:hypothetical protein
MSSFYVAWEWVPDTGRQTAALLLFIGNTYSVYTYILHQVREMHTNVYCRGLSSLFVQFVIVTYNGVFTFTRKESKEDVHYRIQSKYLRIY